MFPEYLVNRWIGHTQQVAEAHYTQVLSCDFIDAYNAEKNVPKTSPEHAGIGYCGVEVEKSNIVANSFISIAYNEMPCNARSRKTASIPPRGIEPLFSD